MTRLECRMLAVRTADYPVSAATRFASQPCRTRAEWLKYGAPFALLAAIRDDLEPLKLPNGEIYCIPGFLRAKSEICALLKMDAWRFIGLLSLSPREVARRFWQLAEELPENEPSDP